MGLGGHLMWSSVFRTLHETTGQPIRVGYVPLLSDLSAGRLYRGDQSAVDDPIFRHNPRVDFAAVRAKQPWQIQLDRGFAVLLRCSGLWPLYERAIFALSRARYRATGRLDAHIDMQLHRYVKRERPDRFEWKKGGHIIDVILKQYGVPAIDHQCEMYFTSHEIAAAVVVCREHGIIGDYVVIEPNSGEDWFSDLRAWPFERWQEVVDRIRAGGRLHVVQIGEGGRPVLGNVINLCGKIPFRIAVLVMKRARLFLGLEGGLMHAANAVGVPSVIVWGGVTLPEFAAYQGKHRVICHYVECAPCGLRRDCPYGKKCLTSIQADEVMSAIEEMLEAGIGGASSRSCSYFSAAVRPDSLDSRRAP